MWRIFGSNANDRSATGNNDDLDVGDPAKDFWNLKIKKVEIKNSVK
jgi:hypothetical protein